MFKLRKKPSSSMALPPLRSTPTRPQPTSSKTRHGNPPRARSSATEPRLPNHPLGSIPSHNTSYNPRRHSHLIQSSHHKHLAHGAKVPSSLPPPLLPTPTYIYPAIPPRKKQTRFINQPRRMDPGFTSSSAYQSLTNCSYIYARHAKR